MAKRGCFGGATRVEEDPMGNLRAIQWIRLYMYRTHGTHVVTGRAEGLRVPE